MNEPIWFVVCAAVNSCVALAFLVPWSVRYLRRHWPKLWAGSGCWRVVPLRGALRNILAFHNEDGTSMLTVIIEVTKSDCTFIEEITHTSLLSQQELCDIQRALDPSQSWDGPIVLARSEP